jgi:uncharacterized protein YqeY
MSIVADIRLQLVTSMREKDEIKKNILRIILGDLSTSEVRSGKISTDDDVRRVIKKLIESNLETLKFCADRPDSFLKLTTENSILSSFLPKTLSKEDIKGYINFSSTMIVSEIKDAKSDGQATGVLIKWLKQNNYGHFDGFVASEVVKEIRNDS